MYYLVEHGRVGYGLLMYPFARLLQIAGLIVPPLAIIAQLNNSISLGQMLLFLVASISAFYIGRILEGIARG